MIIALQKTQMARATRILRKTKDKEAAKRAAPTLLISEIAEMGGEKTEETLVETAKPAHACPECGRLFSSLEMLQRHLLTHPKKDLHTCALCDLQVVGLSAFQNHLVLHFADDDEEI